MGRPTLRVRRTNSNETDDSAQINRSECYNSSDPPVTKKQELAKQSHPREKTTFAMISGPMRVFLTLVGVLIIAVSMFDAAKGVLRGDAIVSYFDLPVILGAGIMVFGVSGYVPIFPEFNPHAPIASGMLGEIFKALVCLVPVLVITVLIESWVESQGYDRQPKDRSLSRYERRFAPTVFSKLYVVPVKVDQGSPVRGASPREIDASAISVPFPHTGQRQLFVTYMTSLEGPLSASRVQELMKEAGAIGIKIEGEVTEDEWAAFCVESAKLSPPLDLLNCSEKIPALAK